MPPFQSDSSGTVVMLTGKRCGSVGSFWAVTVTAGSVTWGIGWGAWALASAGAIKLSTKALKRTRIIMQRLYDGPRPTAHSSITEPIPPSRKSRFGGQALPPKGGNYSFMYL